MNSSQILSDLKILCISASNRVNATETNSYQSESYGIKTGIITHGDTAVNEVVQKKKKSILNDPIVVGLHDSQLKIIPFTDEWNTGICIQPIEINNDGETVRTINEYVRKVIYS